MQTVIRGLIVYLIGMPAFLAWLVGMYRSFLAVWLVAEQQTAPDLLHRAIDWKQIAQPAAAMSIGYLMFKFGAVLLGERHWGRKPKHLARALALHSIVQILALLTFFEGVAVYHSARRESAGTEMFAVICGASFAALLFCCFLSRKWWSQFTDRRM